MNLNRVKEWIEGGCSSYGVPAYDIEKLINAYTETKSALRELVDVTEGTKGLPYSAAYSAAMRALTLGGESK